MSLQTTDNPKPIVAGALARLGEIATLPEVTVKIMELVENPDGTAEQLHNVIKRDPALSAKLLSVVNSAFYGLPGQVGSLDRAIVLLGGAAVKNIAIAASLACMFTGRQKLDRFDTRSLWTHSIAVGVAAKAISAAADSVAPADEVFLAGLIHDVGLLVERQALPEKLVEVVRRCGAGEGNLLRLEQEIIGATHQEFGEALTANWRFPPRLRAAAGSHHNPEGLPDDSRGAGLVLHCADVLCCQEALGFDLPARHQELTPELLDAVGISNGQLAGVRDALAAEVAEAETVFGADL